MWRWPLDDFLWGSQSSIKKSRWLFTCVAGLSLMTMACISFSWQQFSLLLIEGRSYEWRCAEAEIAARSRGDGAACLAQEKSTADLFSYLVICQALSGLLAGSILDHADGRVCAICGVLMNLLARALNASASPSFRAYDAAVILDGLACNLVAFPALALAELFPKHPNCSFAFVLTAEFLGATVTPVMWRYYLDHPNLSVVRLWVGYTLAIVLPLGFIFLLVIPPKGTARVQHERLPTATTSITANEDDSGLLLPMGVTRSASDLVVTDGNPHIPMLTKVLAFLHQLVSLQFLLFGLTFCIFMFQHTFYPAVLRDLAGLTISEFQGSFQASQAAWAISLGFVADYISNQAMCVALLIMTCTVYGLILNRHNTACQKTAAVIFTIAHSYVFTIRFTFVRESFTAPNRGKLLGVVGILSAVTNTINIPVNRTTHYALWSYIMMGLSILQLPIIFFWYRWQLDFEARQKALSLHSLPSTRSKNSLPYELPDS